MKRAGLFGGTFNPVHFGHLRTALEVMEGFGLDTIYFIPSAVPPHKENGGIADAAHRVEMLTRAISEMPGFCFSDVELRRSGLSYTIDTIGQMAAELPASTECFLIVGLDAFLEIDTWKSYRGLFEKITFIVMSRPPQSGGYPGKPFDGIEGFVKNKISAGFILDSEGKRFVHPEWQPVYLFEVTPLGIAATDIRRRVRRGASIRYLVPDSVAAYIDEKGLYR